MNEYRFWRLLTACAWLFLPSYALAQGGGIRLLEPIAGVREIPVDGFWGLGALGYYFSLVYPWIVGMGAGTAVLMALWGGMEIIQAGADTGKRDEGKKRLLISLGGLLLILFSATFLNAFNPTFFQ